MVLKQSIWVMVFVLLFSLSKLKAQTNNNPFYTKIYTTADGLPDSYVLNVFQDKRSYLWASTYTGLSRFDGKNFYNYTYSNGLPDLYINLMHEDHQNRIWIATRRGMGYIKNEKYVHTHVNDSMLIDYVFSYSVNPQGKLLALTGKGLYEWNEKIWIKRNLIPRWKNEAIRTIVYSNDGDYISYTNHLVKLYKDGSYKIIDSNFSISPYYLDLKKYKNDILLHTATGISRIAGESIIPLFQDALKNVMVYTTFKDSKNRIWVSTHEKGLFVSEPDNSEKFEYNVPVPNTLISNIYEDRENNIWLADFAGLIKLRESFFQTYTPVKSITPEIRELLIADNKKPLAYDFINGFYSIESGTIVKTKIYTSTYLQFAGETDSKLLDVLQPAEDGIIWAVTRSRKLLKIHPFKTEEIVIKGADGKPLPVSHVTYNAKLKKLIVCADGLYEFSENKFIPLKLRNNTQAMHARKTFIASNGNILVFTTESKILVIDKSRTVHSAESDLKLPAFTTRINFYEGPDQTIWIAPHGAGLHHYKWNNNNRLELQLSVTTRQGLPNNVVTGVCFDRYGRVWAATLSGIVILESTEINTEGLLPMIVIDKKNYDFKAPVSESFSKLLVDENNKIWFSGGGSIIIFDPGKIGRMLQPPTVSIEKVSVNLLDINWKTYADTVKGFFGIPVDPVLPSGMNNFIFHFKGISYADEGEVLYSSRTEGADNKWSPPFSSSMISSIRFSPGTYTLHVRAKKANSDWSEPVSFKFKILQPWWNTWLFRVIGIAITSFFLVTIFRRQTKQVKREAEIKNKLRELELKALKAQMNPHFIYNALNSIQSLVVDKRNEEAQEYMVKFSRLLRRVLNHSEEHVITLESELASLELYIELEALRLHYQLNYTITVDDHLIPEKEWLPPLILQPFVENALWHGLSYKEGEKKLSIHISEADEWLMCTISDNGTGRKTKNSFETSFIDKGPRGMDITKGRLATFNQTNLEESIQVIDEKNELGHPSGTTVIIKVKRV